MSESEPVSDLAYGERTVAVEKPVGRGPSAAKGESPCFVDLLSGTEESLHHPPETMVEDDWAQLSDIIHGETR